MFGTQQSQSYSNTGGGLFGYPPSSARSSSGGFSQTRDTRDEKIRAKDDEIRIKDEIIALLLPPKSVKNEYLEQKPAKYVFQCLDGDIQVSEYGILRTEFYCQVRII